jgi:hypothetical protein
MNIDLNKLNPHEHFGLIQGLARLYMTEDEIHDPKLNCGGQSTSAYWGRVLKKLKEIEERDKMTEAENP